MKQSLHVCALVWLAAGLSACAAPDLTKPGSSHLQEPPIVRRNAPPVTVNATAALNCSDAPDLNQPQFIIGYGSLMQDESRKRTSPQAGPAQPVEVSGYRRGWIAQGSPVGLSTTFLGVVEDRQSRINAVIYSVDPGELAATDRREAQYCRQSVPAADVATLGTAGLSISNGQAWIYVSASESIATPSARFPIVQSYVDIFVSGCLEQEQRFSLKDFALQCLQTTDNWSDHWVNDRQYPRRPFIHQPKAGQIDAMLARQLPGLFSRIKIE